MMVTIHELKVWPEFYEPLSRGDKTAELRYNDRNYQVGDILVLREWEPKTECYSGRVCKRRVSHVVHGMGMVGVIAPLRGLSLKYVMLSLQPVDEAEMWRAA
jgi:Domain of unknown function (DUF3850)